MTLVLSDYILECVLVRNGRCLSLVVKKKIKVEESPLLFNLSHYREEFCILGQLGHAILFHRSYYSRFKQR